MGYRGYGTCDMGIWDLGYGYGILDKGIWDIG